MEDKKVLFEAIERHLEDLSEKELIMVLRFIYSLEDLR